MPGLARAERLDERAGVEIAGRLAARQHHPHAFSGVRRQRPPAAAPRPPFFEVGGQQVHLLDRDALELAEADALQIVDERVGVADEHDRQAIRLEVAARDALDVVRRHLLHALAIGLQLLERQLVEQLIEHLRRDRVGRFDGQREVPDQVGLRAAELAVVDALALQLAELVDDQAQRFGGALGARVGLGDDAAGGLVGVEIRRRAVGETALRAQHLLQPVGALAAEDLHRLIHRQIVVVLARDAELPDANLRLHRVGLVDDDDALGRRRRIDRLERRHLARLPVAERLLDARPSLRRR